MVYDKRPTFSKSTRKNMIWEKFGREKYIFWSDAKSIYKEIDLYNIYPNVRYLSWSELGDIFTSHIDICEKMSELVSHASVSIKTTIVI